MLWKSNWKILYCLTSRYTAWYFKAFVGNIGKSKKVICHKQDTLHTLPKLHLLFCLFNFFMAWVDPMLSFVICPVLSDFSTFVYSFPSIRPGQMCECSHLNTRLAQSFLGNFVTSMWMTQILFIVFLYFLRNLLTFDVGASPDGCVV